MYLLEYNPEWVFFLDWSWIVPKEVLKNYKCVCFHESDLPNFRGGLNEYKNLAISCSSCNHKKGRKTVEEFIQQ